MFSKYHWAGPLLLGIFFILGYLCPAAVADDNIRAEVATIIRENYVEPVSTDVLTAPTVKEMLKRLGDPYARYLTQEECQEELDTLDGNFTGVGIYINAVSDGVQVLSIITGSPAAKAGLKKNDVIVAADETTLVGVDSDKAMQILRGEVGSTVVLKVKRDGQVLSFNIIREKIEVPTVHPEMLDTRLGYLGIDDFGQRTYSELQKAVKSLKQAKADNWIVDLRGNPGGYLESAIDIAGVFMGEAPVVVVEERDSVNGYTGTPSDAFIDGALVLLQDDYSASAAEILAGAMRDNQRAVLIGKTTYGKGTVQQIFPLSNGDNLKMTIARFYSPAGEEINGVGIKPDIEVEDENCLAVAKLILSDNRDTLYGSMIALELDSFMVAVDTGKLRQAGYWKAWADIIDGIGDAPVYYGNDSGWTELSAEERKLQWSYYYPGYEFIGDISELDISIDMKSGLNERYINDFNIELINAKSGQRMKSELKLVNDSTFNCHPLKPLEPGEYWLVIHNTLRFADGQRLSQAQIATVRVP
ncbi:MAG: S41 family peptidase [Syntrophomonadaceae bacterium]|nr:S41 family peptidase [Syntrophomonadaceae bacterium]